MHAICKIRCSCSCCHDSIGMLSDAILLTAQRRLPVRRSERKQVKHPK